MKPVGRTVTRAGEAVSCDKGFQQQRAVAIAALPVHRESPGCQPQYLGGEVFRAYPGQDQEAGVVDDEMEVLLALPMAPADEAVARGALPGGGTKAQQRDHDPIAQLRAGEGLKAEIVVAVDESVPQAGVRTVAGQPQLQRRQGMGWRVNGVLRVGFGKGAQARLRATARSCWRFQ